MSASDEERIAGKFRRYGWLGVWIQAVLGILPLAMLCYILLKKTTNSGVMLGFMDYLALVGLAILAFTTFWSYRYTRLARRIADPGLRPEWTLVVKTLRVGIWASCIGIVVSLLLLIIEVFRLLFLFLKTPQAGVPVIRTEAENRAAWVSAIDVVSLLAEVCTLVGELLVVAFALWLLFAVLKQMGVFDGADHPADAASSTT
jgi:hypothetical protein